MSRITVVGAGYAGLMALQRLRMQVPDAELFLVEPRAAFEERIRLHEVAAGVPAQTRDLAALCARLGATHVQRRLAGLHGRTVALDDGTAHEADAVVLAMGSRTRPSPGPAHRVDDVRSARALFEALAQRPDARVTVIGAGATAIEVVMALAHRFPDARLAIWRATPGWGLPAAADAAIDARMQARGVEVIDGGPVIALDADGAGSATHHREHDVAVWCAGFAPCDVPLPGRRTADGRLAVDAFLQLSEGVFAAGDLAVPPVPHRLGCVTALPMGAHAAGNAARWLRGEPLVPFAFRDVVACIALDPGYGLVQALAPDGTPEGACLSGRAGGAVKGLILGYVRSVLALERTLNLPLYRWVQPSAAALETA